MRVAHEDGGLDGFEGGSCEGGAGAAAEGVVHDLAALRVADQDDLRIGAVLVELGHGLDDGLGALARRLLVGDAAALGLAAAGRVDDRLAGRAGIRLLHHVDKALGRAVAILLRHRRLAGAKDVHFRARLPRLDVNRLGAGDASEDGDGNCCDLHDGCCCEEAMGSLGDEGC